MCVVFDIGMSRPFGAATLRQIVLPATIGLQLFHFIDAAVIFIAAVIGRDWSYMRSSAEEFAGLAT